MRKLSFVLLGLFLISNSILSQYRLDIEITECRNDKGLLMLQIFDENQKVVGQEKVTIQDKKSIVTFKDLKPGKYGVRFFHDENSSGVMETNLFGKPTEEYGFSNNATGKFGSPPFEKWLFELSEDKKIILKPVY